jgi:hypothetical protein
VTSPNYVRRSARCSGDGRINAIHVALKRHRKRFVQAPSVAIEMTAHVCSDDLPLRPHRFETC